MGIKKVLWTVNITMPDASMALGLPVTYLGGWLTGYSEALLNNYPEIELHIVEPYSGSVAKRIETIHLCPNESKKIVTHHLFPFSWIEGRYSFANHTAHNISPLSNLLPCYFQEINDEVKPDVVHIHGTELPHSLVWIETCGNDHTIVSIQGLTSVFERYYMGGLKDEDLEGCWSFNDWRFHRTLSREQKKMKARGMIEKELLKKTDHIAGRTSWDKAHAWTMNPNAKYHELQEVLRAPFYEEGNRWQLSKCQRHRIFVSQSHYPIKGLHCLLKAMPIILQHYPDTELYIVGEDCIDQHWRHRSAYVNHLRKLIYKNKLRGKVHYLNSLSPEQMIEQYCLANVFICPSAIENSCNSVCEAQLLGTPIVASYVGGTMNIIDHEINGLLYRFEETEMLAYYICRIFESDQLASLFSENGRKKALKRHDRETIANTLVKIYSWI